MNGKTVIMMNQRQLQVISVITSFLVPRIQICSLEWEGEGWETAWSAVCGKHLCLLTANSCDGYDSLVVLCILTKRLGISSQFGYVGEGGAA